ncbi:MAG TPA: hypothetical protein G4O15_14745 [Dehalococcoidia bacterium]|nr:hypothetical protein [Dehalococcoidia bacterium]
MSNTILAIIPLIITAILYVLIFSRKEEIIRVKRSWRQYDWITFFCCIFGGILFSSAMRSADFQFPALIISSIITVCIFIFVIYAVIRRSRTGRPVIQMMGDERTAMILAKSARNAFFVTYLVLFIRLCITDAGGLDESWMLIVLGSGLLALLLSLPVYAYWKL